MIDATKLKALKGKRLLPGPGVESMAVLRGTLRTRTSLHVGVGETATADERGGNLLRTAREAPEAGADPWAAPPTIPSTSLRGVLRGWCEGMLGPYGPAVASVNGECLTVPASEDEIAAERLRDELDLVSGVFGAMRWRSKLDVGPGTVSDPARRQHPSRLLHVVPGVAIDPRLGTAADGKLFETEFVRPGVAFQVEFAFTNAHDWEVGLVLAALDAFNHPNFPLRLGGRVQQHYGGLEWEARELFALGWSGASVLDEWVAAYAEGRPGTPRPHPRADLDRCIAAFANTWRGLRAA